MSCRRLGEQVLRPGLHFILDPLQPSNAVAFKFSRMGCGEASIISKSIGKNKACSKRASCKTVGRRVLETLDEVNRTWHV